ncbi:hypothetical protein MMAN_13580 [Mycobacterium mantenii]|uniref:Uncharacterized protein n=1 Tax=Mycobacterium mantenii TaxID=560555 RepID=A0ABM7JNV9_MYCNT|nr:hypothetical protein MMAN_13580 [Mycobacterium mantenii]
MLAQDRFDGTAEQVGDVGADLTHLERRLVHDREHTARLDAAGDVDRFTRTVVQVDRSADRYEIVDRLIRGCRWLDAPPVAGHVSGFIAVVRGSSQISKLSMYVGILNQVGRGSHFHADLPGSDF